MSRNTWTTEDFAAYVKAGSPEGWEPPRKMPPPVCTCPSPSCLLHGYPAPPEDERPQAARTEKRAGGRIPRTIVDATAEVGCKFDSKAEARRYDWLMAREDVVHVDVHPIFTLPGGIRYCADFLVWTPWVEAVYLGAGEHGRVWAEDVKGRAPSTAFRRVRRLFDAHHPLAPMRVVVWRKGEWQEI